MTSHRVSRPDPVFVLCAARTGSTLLRLLLDCHPQLTCPAETNLPLLCYNMVPAWSLVTGNPVPVPNMPFKASQLPRDVTAGLRQSMDLIMSAHLQRTGKSRWCDKSLAAGRYAELLLQVFPGATFLCLHRFPMDVIASALEACPYGLAAYGYDPYIAASPGNSVLAVARCWLEQTGEIMTAEEDFGDHSLRLRYEDLVSDPETVMDGVFEFLRVPPVPDIAAQCFRSEPERLGMADYKIWHTNRIGTDSIGRGWGIPPGLIAAPVLEGINELSGRLGYIPVDPASWGIGSGPMDVRTAAAAQAPAALIAGPSHAVVAVAEALRDNVRSVLQRLADAAPPWWLAVASDTMIMNVVPDTPDQGGSVQVLINVRARSVELLASQTAAQAELPGDCMVSGPAAIWRRVMAGAANLGVVMRLNQIRFSGRAPDWVAGEMRLAMISHLLGLTATRQDSTQAGRAAVPAVLA